MDMLPLIVSIIIGGVLMILVFISLLPHLVIPIVVKCVITLSPFKKRWLRLENNMWCSYLERGSVETCKESLIVLHGASGSAVDFIKYSAHFGNTKHLVLLNLLNHSDTACLSREVEMEDMIDYINEFLQKSSLQSRKVHLIGFSLGGFFSIHYTARYPEKIKSLFLINPHGLTGINPELEEIWTSLYDSDLHLRTNAQLKELMDIMSSGTMPAIPNIVLTFLRHHKNNMSTKENHVVKASMLREIVEPSLLQKLKDVKVMYLQGEVDRVTRKEGLDYFKEHVPHTISHIIENGSHIIAYTHIKDICALANEWYESMAKSSRLKLRILVVGAGPTGLTAANELCYNGIKPKIIEKRNGSSNFSRAVGILNKTLNDYEHLGLRDVLLERGIHINHGMIYLDGELVLDLNIAKLTDEINVLSLPQDQTEKLLEDNLNKDGVFVEYGVGYESVVKNVDDSLDVTFSNGKTETFDYIIGCDGSKSRVASSIGIEKFGYTLPEDWYIYDFYSKRQDIDCALTSKTKEGLLFIIRIGDKRYRAVSDYKANLDKLPCNFEVESIFREGSFKITVAQVKTYSKDNIVLCGDAAHTHSPVGGRGMNLGINDAFAAVRAIMENDLDKYNFAQHKKGEEILRFTEAARKRISSNSTLNNFMLKFIIGILSKSEKLQRIFAKKMTSFE